jgi:hypothetical protein
MLNRAGLRTNVVLVLGLFIVGRLLNGARPALLSLPLVFAPGRVFFGL